MWESSSTEELVHFERIVHRNPLVAGSTPASPLEINLRQEFYGGNSCLYGEETTKVDVAL